jgi:hypothetical protein
VGSVETCKSVPRRSHFSSRTSTSREKEVPPDAPRWRLLTLQNPELPTQPNGFDCGIFVPAFVCFAVVNISFCCGLNNGDKKHEFAASLCFQLANSFQLLISCVLASLR